MSNLTIGLAICGGLVLAGVVAHGAWTSRRNAPKLAQAELRDDAPAAGTTAHEGDSPVRVEPAFGDMLSVHPPARKEPVLDALLDVIAPVAVETPVSGEAAIAALPPTRRAGSKPFAVEGLNVVSAEWEPPAPGQRYGAFQAGVLLANRTGALNEIEFSEFVQKAQAFADAVNGAAEFPEMLEEVSRARELDQFANGHDAQLSFTLRARNAAWSPGYVQQSAAKLGFVAGALPGRMVLPASAAGLAPILDLSFDSQAAMADDPAQTAIRELRLSLDVPQVPRSEQPFVRMRESAIALAASMDGLITDDNAQVIRVDALDVIGADLEQLYDTLDAHELSAGSPLARRLFS